MEESIQDHQRESPKNKNTIRELTAMIERLETDKENLKTALTHKDETISTILDNYTPTTTNPTPTPTPQEKKRILFLGDSNAKLISDHIRQDSHRVDTKILYTTDQLENATINNK